MKSTINYFWVLASFTCLMAGCSISVVMPEVDLNQTQWQLWSGQAVWNPGPEHPTVVGEVILAQHENGDVYVNLAKPPLVIFTVQTSGKHWSIDLLEADKSHRGRWRPPHRFIWFYLPSVLHGKKSLGKGWEMQRMDNMTWVFEHKKRQERIQLVLDE